MDKRDQYAFNNWTIKDTAGYMWPATRRILQWNANNEEIDITYIDDCISEISVEYTTYLESWAWQPMSNIVYRNVYFKFPENRGFPGPPGKRIFVHLVNDGGICALDGVISRRRTVETSILYLMAWMHYYG